MKVLELYSGIGGMHLGLKASNVSGEIITSIDINTVANVVYKHNFPTTNLLNRNIQGLSAQFINKLEVDTILMSPPCQPFTRNGLKKDVKDPRTDSFMHVLGLIPQLNIKNILIENVKGFETSEMREILIKTLNDENYQYQEYILSPHQFGVPNTRHRYYCVAVKEPKTFQFETSLIFNENASFKIGDIIENNVDVKYFLSDDILLKKTNILDVCFNESFRSCCFTKAYGRYIEGTGSVYCDKTKNEFDQIYKESKNYDDFNSKLECLMKLNLRYFTPREVLRLMCFPENFNFPDEITDKQCFNLIGNSVNIKVVSELIKLFN
nr:tRNA (cytosine-5-)-methyltransferase [Onthophagus taurus]